MRNPQFEVVGGDDPPDEALDALLELLLADGDEKSPAGAKRQGPVHRRIRPCVHKKQETPNE